MRKIVLILGGARSGKSTFALHEVSAIKGEKAFIATAEGFDDEMRLRIEKHKEERGKGWITFEEPLSISTLIQNIRDSYPVILIDCLTLWVSNIMRTGFDFNDEVTRLVDTISQKHSALIYIVSNEVGMGLVPGTELGREYRDNIGFLNRKVAEAATDVYFMAAGIPMKIKGDMKIE
ncbi:MAG: bifunctional adenosylcobinamide kinase/adenosylcobinamide-phosphate guanylyltransferase [Syntrophus sp. (in: bacteria)]|nr:bifunctional adenosylcobinamide kinase/adenosylcobinamide-phosphate guanylyltransferase [Syntrophus sp. (in: bacteria)]